jgi:hypothetical protein
MKRNNIYVKLHEHAITRMCLFLITLYKVKLGHDVPYSVETWNDIKLYQADHESRVTQGFDVVHTGTAGSGLVHLTLQYSG